jgi:hypothetical protein
MRDDGQGVFRDARSALLFAMHFQGEQFATSTLARMAQEGTIGRGAGLHGLDGAAMAGIVRARLGRLESRHAAALVARHADAGCAPWLAAADEIARFIGETEACREIDDAVLAASVRKFFGERRTDKAIADEIGAHRVTVNRWLRQVRPELERLEAESDAQWESSLRDAGLILDY